MLWAVVHDTPDGNIVKLVITGVPEDVSPGELRYLLQRAGYTYTDETYDLPWVDHYLLAEHNWPDDVREALHTGEAEVVHYNNIVAKVEDRTKVFTLRIPPELHKKLVEVAKARGQSQNTLILSAIKAYLQEIERQERRIFRS